MSAPAGILASTLADMYPHGLIHDRGRPVGMWVAHPGKVAPGGPPCLDVLGISRMGPHLAVHRTSSAADASAARGAILGCRSSPFPADPRDDARSVVALMAGTLAGDDGRDWFVPRVGEIAADLDGLHPRIAAGDIDAAARGWVGAIHRDVAAFVATLDPEAVRLAVRPRVRAAFKGQAWAAFDRTFADDVPLARALAWMPDMPILLAGLWRDLPDDLAACVDRGHLARLVAARLSEDHGMPGRMQASLAAALDAMAGLPDHEAVAVRNAIDTASWGVDKIVAAVDLMRGLPPNWVPRDAPEWLSCLGTGHQVLRQAARMSLAPASHARLVGAGHGWRDLERRVAAAMGIEGPTPSMVRGALDGIDDAVRSFARQVAIPCVAADTGSGRDEPLAVAARQGLEDAAGRILMSGRSLPGLLEWSARWHGRQAGIQARLEALHREHPWRTGWPPGFPDATVLGIDIVVLPDAAALSAEGKALGHCVGGYSSDCMDGTCRILSLRRDGRRLSTAEVRRRGDDGCEVVATQHRGPENTDPTTAEGEALAAYLASLGDGSRTWDPAELEPVPAGERRDTARDAGYEWWRTGHLGQALDAWRPFLPRAARRMDPAGWARALDAATGAGPRWGEVPFGHRGWRWPAP